MYLMEFIDRQTNSEEMKAKTPKIRVKKRSL